MNGENELGMRNANDAEVHQGQNVVKPKRNANIEYILNGEATRTLTERRRRFQRLQPSKNQ